MAAPLTNTCRKYILHFANDHLDFKLPEIKAIAYSFGICIRIIDEDLFDKNIPYLVVECACEEDVKKIMGRSSLARSAYEFWGQSATIKDLLHCLQDLMQENVSHYLSAEHSFKIVCDSFNKTLTPPEKLERINAIVEALNFKGPVNLSQPDQKYFLFEHYGIENGNPTVAPKALLFGRWVADGQRHLIQKYNLKKRCYIANTSMDPNLSLIMSNLAAVKENHMVLDPFVGSGSLLVAAAHYGAYVMGTDIDYLTVHAKGKSSRHDQKIRGESESIHNNLKQYGLADRFIDVIVGDASKHTMWRESGIFDAIITDPPYGIREGSKKINKKESHSSGDETHTPQYAGSQKSQYDLSESFLDLLNFSAKFLKLHGRLVFWLPVVREEYVEENIPTHPCLRLIANCEQILTWKVSRRLITMEKCREMDQEAELKGASYRTDHFQDSFRARYFEPGKDKTDTGSNRTREKIS